jgi:hypothetical protein
MCHWLGSGQDTDMCPQDMCPHTDCVLKCPRGATLFLPVAACLCLSLPVSACLCLSLPVSACLCLSLPVSACLCPRQESGQSKAP